MSNLSSSAATLPMLRQKFLDSSQPDEWRSHLPAHRSVFGSLEYARICETYRGCAARLYIVQSELASICHPVLLRPVSDLQFAAEVEGSWDATTADFTGPILTGRDDELAGRFRDCHNAFMQAHGVIAEFAHVHPWSGARELLGENCIYNRDIVWVDVTLDPETLYREHFEHACRKNIQKAQREGVTIVTETGGDALKEFHRIYRGTMERNGALDRYYFPIEFFERFRDDLAQNARFVFAQHGGKIVASTLYLHDDNDVFSFLGGADAEFNHLRPTNLVVWDTILWAHRQGKKRLILGGGYKPDDGIFRFKATFSPLRQPFYVYKRVHCERDYALLDAHCRELNGMKDAHVDYFPSYRYVKSTV